MKSIAICFVVIIVIQNGLFCDAVPHTEAPGEKVQKDTVVKDIPKDKQRPSYRRMAQNIERLIGLSSLENGFNGLAIRIWGGPEAEKLINLRKQNNQWVGEEYTLRFHYQPNTDSLVSIDKTVRSITPASGWRALEDSLENLKVATMPDMGEILNYTTGTDERGITIEVATPAKYRIYSYWSPERYQQELAEARNIVRLRQLISREFGIKQY